jgi:hypothetical protein
MLTFFLGFLVLINSCGIYKKTDQRNKPQSGIDKARKNVTEGKGISIGSLRGNNKGTNFEFSSSNPMWRASLEILDFLPLLTVDYSGGIIISDWYSTDNSNESIKITVRFFNNEISSGNLKVIVHQRKCSSNNNCSTIELKSKIREELAKNILTKATILEVEQKKKK